MQNETIRIDIFGQAITVEVEFNTAIDDGMHYPTDISYLDEKTETMQTVLSEGPTFAEYEMLHNAICDQVFGVSV